MGEVDMMEIIKVREIFKKHQDPAIQKITYTEMPDNTSGQALAVDGGYAMF